MKNRKKDIYKIAGQIKELVDQLIIVAGRQSTDVKSSVKVAAKKGCSGALMLLIEERFFDTPKEISSVMEKLREIGHYHKQTAVAMNLLNLAKKRTLNRFRNKETKNWEYVLRK